MWIFCYGSISAPDLMSNWTVCIAYHQNNRCNTSSSFSSSNNDTPTPKTSPTPRHTSFPPSSLQPVIIIAPVPPTRPGPTASTTSGIPTTSSVASFMPPVACLVSSSQLTEGLNKQRLLASTIPCLREANDKFRNNFFPEGKSLRLSDR